MFRVLLIILGIMQAASCFGAQTTIVTGANPTHMENLAAKELQRYIYAASGQMLPIATQAKGNAIALGTPASNPLVRRLEPNLAGLGDQGYLLRTVKDGKRTVLLVTGNTPISVLYGAYSLLEEIGVGFYLGGDAIPAKKPFTMPSLNVSRKPAFKIRGTLPWYNFFNSPTTWDYQDYCWFFDNLVKTKNNFIGFHAYDYEPFCAYEDGGKYVYGEPIATTDVPTWGTHSMKTSEFGFGTGKYFPDEYFGSKPGLYRNDRERSIRDSQALLKKAFDYAHFRGLKTCLGFEVSGYDPTDPAAVQVLEKRLKHLVTQYPMLDYVWIWEVEAVGLHGINPPALDSRFGSYYRRWEPTFAYLKEPRKIAEGVRLALYANEAHRILKEIAPEKKLIVSGWGGDNHLHCTDFYPGLDKIVPKDVIFSALDNIVISPTVSAAYGKLSPDREKWPIPWLEYDGDQWHNQANAERWLGACQDSLAKAGQGILGIHWRTRDVEEAHAVMSQFAWEPKMTYQQFYLRYAKKTFGPKYAVAMAKILMDLQALGYRWVGGHGQTECGGFGWGSPADPEKVRKLTEIQPKVQAVLDDLSKTPGCEHQAEYAAYLYNTIDWTLRYEQTAQALIPDGEVTKLLLQARAEKSAGKDDEAAKTASEALTKLADCDFGAALDACARRVTDKGSMGMLATVNAKAYWSYREIVRELSQLAGETTDSRPQTTGTARFPAWSGTHVIAVSSVPASKPKPAPKIPVAEVSDVTVKPGEGCALVLRWQGPMARYEISRSENGGPPAPIATVTDTWFEDRDVKPSASYRYSVSAVGGKAVTSASIVSPGFESVPAPEASAAPKRGKVWLQWGKAPLGVAGYRIFTASASGGPWARVSAPDQVSANSFDAHLQVVPAEPGKNTYYRVAPVDRFGNEGAQSGPVECTALPLGELKPVLAEDFSPEDLAGRTWGGHPMVQSINGASVAYFRKGEYLAYAHRPEFNPEVELSLMMWLKLESPGVMPVMLGHGMWSQDGYFLQTYNSTVRFNLEGVGYLDAGHIEPGKWYHIAATYDGIAMKVYLNGKEVGSKRASGTPKPCSRTLFIARYESPDDLYETDCRVGAVRIYTVGLTASEISTEYLRLSDKLR